MTTLPPPPVPADLDLRDCGWVPFSIARIVDDPVLEDGTPEQFRAAFRLWLKCWHQVPAASLPDDDAKLCKWAGFGSNMAAWSRVRAGALEGFQKCSDGRLYHGAWAYEAVNSGKLKANRTAEREADRIRKAQSRALEKAVDGLKQPDLPLKSAGHPADTAPVSAGHPPDGPPENALQTDIQTNKQKTYGDADQLTWVNRLAEAMGRPWAEIHPLKWAPFPELVLRWRQEGVDLEGVVVPVVKACLEQMGGKFPETPRYLDAAVRRHLDRLQTARAPIGASPRPKVVSIDTAERNRFLAHLNAFWRPAREWKEAEMGPPPSSPGYRGPRDMLTPEDLVPTIAAKAAVS